MKHLLSLLLFLALSLISLAQTGQFVGRSVVYNISGDPDLNVEWEDPRFYFQPGLMYDTLAGQVHIYNPDGSSGDFWDPLLSLNDPVWYLDTGALAPVPILPGDTVLFDLFSGGAGSVLWYLDTAGTAVIPVIEGDTVLFDLNGGANLPTFTPKSVIFADNSGNLSEQNTGITYNIDNSAPDRGVLSLGPIVGYDDGWRLQLFENDRTKLGFAGDPNHPSAGILGIHIQNTITDQPSSSTRIRMRQGPINSDAITSGGDGFNAHGSEEITAGPSSSTLVKLNTLVSSTTPDILDRSRGFHWQHFSGPATGLSNYSSGADIAYLSTFGVLQLPKYGKYLLSNDVLSATGGAYSSNSHIVPGFMSDGTLFERGLYSAEFGATVNASGQVSITIPTFFGESYTVTVTPSGGPLLLVLDTKAIGTATFNVYDITTGALAVNGTPLNIDAQVITTD